MLVKLFGLLDLALGTSLLLLHWDILYYSILFIALPILVKALYYIKDPSSIVDIFGIIFIGLAFMGYFPVFTYVIVFWFLQKGFRSLI